MKATSHRRVRRARLFAGSVLAALTLASIAPGAHSAENPNPGTSPCTVPSGSFPTLQSAIDDLSCEGAVLAGGDYQGPFRITRDFPITGPNDFSARLLGGLEIEGDANVDVRLEYVQVQVGLDPSLIFDDDFEAGNTAAWSQVTP